MRKITDKWKYPAGLRRFIYNNTDYKTMTLKARRFVSTLEMFNKKPLLRIFAYAPIDKHKKKSDIIIKEVARYYNHHQYLGQIGSNMFGKVIFWEYEDYFTEYDKHIWLFYDIYKNWNADEFLKKHNLKYTGWNEYVENQKKNNSYVMRFDQYLTYYLQYPKIELLAKSGLGKWIPYIKHLDINKKQLHEIFKVSKGYEYLLFENCFGYKELLKCRRIKGYDMERLNYEISKEDWYKEYRYLNFKIKEKLIRKTFKSDMVYKYLKDKAINVSDYLDYLNDLYTIGAITDKNMLCPVHFNSIHRKTHLEAVEIKEARIQEERIKELAKYEKGFKKAYKKYSKYFYEDSSLMIRPVKEALELYHESNILEHCVRTYDKMVADGETEIMFIRKLKKEDEPYYTLEIKGKKVIQVRGLNNRDPSKKVKDFVTCWANKYQLKYSGIND